MLPFRSLLGAGRSRGTQIAECQDLRLIAGHQQVLPRKLSDAGSYEDERLPGEVYILVGAFDDAESFESEVHN